MKDQKAKFTRQDVAQLFSNGIIRENPVLILVLGMCPTLAVSTSLLNALGMGLSATAVLMCSNVVISLLRKVIPNKIRIASYIVIIAGFVTIVDLLLQAYAPALSASLGLFIPLIVVNCIILGRAEAFASKNPPLPSFLDGLAMGLGFTFALAIMGTIREILGSGTLLGYPILGSSFQPIMLIAMPCGGFFTLGCIIAASQWLRGRREAKK